MKIEVKMKKEQFLRSVEAIVNLRADSLTGKESLDYARDWDSLAIVGFLSFADREFRVAMSVPDIQKCSTYDELFLHLIAMSNCQHNRLAS